jgi:two-component system NarL family sensor kinase
MQTPETAYQIFLVILLGTLLFVFLGACIFIFVLISKQKQRKSIEERAQLSARYIQESLRSQVEVQNETLTHVGQDLHDNIGQLLSVIRITLSAIEEDIYMSVKSKEDIKHASDIVDQAIFEVRSLSKSLDASFVKDFGLYESVQVEVERLRKSRRFLITVDVSGDIFKFHFDTEIVIFRIFQEVLNNMIKHSDAKNISFEFEYDEHGMQLIAKDDGKGFNYNEVMQRSLNYSGAGLKNIIERVNLIGGDCEFNSSLGMGTVTTLKIPKIVSLKLRQ